MKSENVIENAVNNKNLNTIKEENTTNAANTDAAKTEKAVEAVKDSTNGSPKRDGAAQTEITDVKEEAQSVPAVQEVDTLRNRTQRPSRNAGSARSGKAVR